MLIFKKNSMYLPQAAGSRSAGHGSLRRSFCTGQLSIGLHTGFADVDDGIPIRQMFPANAMSSIQVATQGAGEGFDPHQSTGEWVEVERVMSS